MSLFGFDEATKVFLYTQAADMRKGFDGLYGLVQNVMEMDPCLGYLFVFINKQGTRIKILHWQKDGLAGVHSGDSNATLPPFNLGEFVMQQIKDHTHKIALALKTVGLINIQFAIKDDTVYIIEANPRASRTVPFIAKAYGEPYVNYATKVMLGTHKVTDFTFNPQLKGFAIKQPVFSFNKFPNVNKKLGPEMKSTGESILFIEDLKDDQFYELYSRRKMYLSR